MEKKKRNTIVGYIAVAVIIFFVVLMFIGFSSEDNQEASSSEVNNEQNNNKEETPESVLNDVRLYGEIKRIDDNRGHAGSINVQLNNRIGTGQEGTTNLIIEDMARVYKSLYNDNNFDVEEVTVASFLGVADQYGNDKEEIFFQTKLDKETAEKINWDQDEASLLYTFIPNNWTVEKDRMDSINW